ncbi:MAG: UbiX family flavin prenyltransferase [Planctomycetaceae bacterium]|nr:UbiX family flavin prenyltransferase [Planctomycetaceae bacterium]
MNSKLPVVLAVTGASGSAYAMRLAQVLLSAGVPLELIVSEAARQVAHQELGETFPRSVSPADWLTYINSCTSRLLRTEGQDGSEVSLEQIADQFVVHDTKDLSGGPASGSYRTRAMVICPCSMGTLASVASGCSTNLIHRAADVHLKERRHLILVPRETPLSTIALENMLRLSNAGATIMPAAPGFYHRPAGIADLVDFMVARICDHLDIEHNLISRWGVPVP